MTTLQTVFPGGAGRWGVRRTRIREDGLPLELLVITDLTQALARAGTAGLAAPGAGAGPRAEQFADADQVDRRQPGSDCRRASRCPTIGGTTCAAA